MNHYNILSLFTHSPPQKKLEFEVLSLYFDSELHDVTLTASLEKNDNGSFKRVRGIQLIKEQKKDFVNEVLSGPNQFKSRFQNSWRFST